MSNDSSTGGFLLPTSTLAINDEALDDLFIATIAAITGLAPRFVVRRFKAEPDAPPQFDGTWAAVGVTGIDDDQFPQQGMTQDDTYQVVAHELLEVMASFYGAKAQQAARMCRNGIQIAQNRDALEAQGIFYMHADRPVKAPALINGRWSNRIDVTLTFRRGIADTFAILDITEIQGGLITDTGLTRPITVIPD